MLSMTISTPLPAVIRRAPSARPSAVRSTTSSKPSSRALAAFAALPAAEIILPAPSVLNDPRPLIAEPERRLRSGVSPRQDRVFERRDAGCRDAQEHPVLCRLRLGQFDLLQPAIARESVCLDRTHRHPPIK